MPNAFIKEHVVNGKYVCAMSTIVLMWEALPERFKENYRRIDIKNGIE